MKYQDNSKVASMMANTIVHEMVYDPNNPIDKIVPFLYSSEQSRKPTPIFRWYLCFLNLTEVMEYKQQNFVQKGVCKEESFDRFCDVFQLRDCEDPCVFKDDQEEDHVRFEN